MKSRLKKWGNSLALRIPKSFAEELEVRDGSEVELTLKEGILLVRPLGTRFNLKELLAQITPENCHRETMTGDATGAEIW